MFDAFIEWVSRLGNFGYLVIFVIATLESAAFLGLLVPGETVVLIAGFLAATGVLDLPRVMLLIAIGAILGDNIGYQLGRHYGRPWLLHYGRWAGLRDHHLDRAHSFFTRHGGKAVCLGRQVGFARATIPFIAGSARMPYWRFSAYDVLGAVVWSVSVTSLGYFLGASWHVAEQWIGKASAIVGIALLLLAFFVWLWRWAVRHEAHILKRWAAFRSRPWAVRWRRRSAPAIAFLHARLSPRSYFGLELSVGVLVLLAAAWVFGAIVKNVFDGDPMTLVDERVVAWFRERATPLFDRVMAGISTVVVKGVIVIGSALLALTLVRKRYWYGLLELTLVVVGALALNGLIHGIFNRTRPTLLEPTLGMYQYDFPSTYVVAATAFYGMLAVFGARWVNAWRWRVLCVLLAVAVVILVAFGRMYLGLNYLSDVLAAMAEGVAWLSLCVISVNTLRSQTPPVGR